MSRVLSSTSFFDKTYADTCSLLVEARNYIAFRQGEDTRDAAPDARLLVSQETMRITCRLTQVMAWMLCQKAVQAGERAQEWALSEENALGGQDICLDDSAGDDDRLPTAVRDLLGRTQRLYQRVQRLDTMMRREAC